MCVVVVPAEAEVVDEEGGREKRSSGKQASSSNSEFAAKSLEINTPFLWLAAAVDSLNFFFFPKMCYSFRPVRFVFPSFQSANE